MILIIIKNEKKVRKIPAFLNLITLCQPFFRNFFAFFLFFYLYIKNNNVE